MRRITATRSVGRATALIIAMGCVLTAVVAATAAPPVTAAAVAAPKPAASATSVSQPLYLEAGTDAAKAAARLRSEGNTASAGLIDQIASQPTAVWLGDWFATDLLKRIIARHIVAAQQQGARLVFVTYAIPNRDCGGYSAGGLTNAQYLEWNRTIATALKGTNAMVLVEPDSLAMLANARCAGTAETRLPLLAGAVKILEAAGLDTYLDGGNSQWLTPTAQALWLRSAGVSEATGFFTNVSNYNRVDAERNYAGKVSSRIGFKHFVIDVSRSGNGWTGSWCNSPGAALGQNPTLAAGTTKLDALLWVKHPGASDGTCNGGPAAGAWFEASALELARLR